MTFYDFIDIGKLKYDGALHTLQALDNKESHDPISFHSLHCKVSGFYYSRYFNAFWLWYRMYTKCVHLLHTFHEQNAQCMLNYRVFKLIYEA